MLRRSREGCSHETFCSECKSESFSFYLEKIEGDENFALMDLGGTSGSPGGVKEGSDEVGAMETFDQWVKPHNISQN